MVPLTSMFDHMILNIKVSCLQPINSRNIECKIQCFPYEKTMQVVVRKVQ